MTSRQFRNLIFRGRSNWRSDYTEMLQAEQFCLQQAEQCQNDRHARAGYLSLAANYRAAKEMAASP